VARRTAGLVANLCVDDFAPIVLDLALTTSTMLDTFFLRARPDLNTLVLRLEGEVVPCDEGSWWYELVERDGVDTPAIRFDPARLPVAGAEILVEYVRGSGKVEDFCPEGGG